MPGIVLRNWRGIDQSEGVKRNVPDKLYSAINCFPTIEKILKRRLGTKVLIQDTSFNVSTYDTTSIIVDQTAGITYDAFCWKDPILGFTVARIRTVGNGSITWANPASYLEWLFPISASGGVWFDGGIWTKPTYARVDPDTYPANAQGIIQDASASNPPGPNPGYYGFKLATDNTGLNPLRIVGGQVHAASVLLNDRLYIFPGPGGTAPWIWLKNTGNAILIPGIGSPAQLFAFDPTILAWAPDIGALPTVGIGLANTFGATGYLNLPAMPVMSAPSLGTAQSVWGDPNALGEIGQALHPTAACLYARGQLCIAGFQGILANLIVFCELDGVTGSPTLSDAMFVAGQYNVGPEGSTDPVVAVITQPLIGGAAVLQTLMLILKRQTAWVGTGVPVFNPSQQENPTFQTQIVHNTAGTVNNRVIAKTPHGTIWVSDDNVWLWAGGPQPIPIGKDVASILRQCSSNVKEWHALYTPLSIEDNAAGGIYRLSLPVSPSYIPEFSNLYLPSERQCNIQLWLDMRPGFDPQNPQWWGPMEIPSSAMYFNFDRRLDRENVRGFYSYGMITGTSGQSNINGANQPSDLMTRHVKYDVAVPDGGDDHVTLPDVTIPAKLKYQPKSHLRVKTHEFDFETPWLRKIIKGLDFVFNPGTGIVNSYVMPARWIGDGGASLISPSIQIINPSSARPIAGTGPQRKVTQTGFFSGITLTGPTSALGSLGSLMSRQFQAVAWRSAWGRGATQNTTRFECKTFQLELAPQPQPTIDSIVIPNITVNYIRTLDLADGTTWYMLISSGGQLQIQRSIPAGTGVTLNGGDVIYSSPDTTFYAIGVTNGQITATTVVGPATTPYVYLQSTTPTTLWALADPNGQINWSVGTIQPSLVWELEADQPDLEILSIGVNINTIRRPPQ